MRGRGFTLVEVLVASVVGVLLVGTVAMFALLGVRLWHSAAEKVEVDESALLALHAFEAMLQASDVGSVYLNPSGVAAGVSFLSGVDGTGRLQYLVSTPGASPTAARLSTPGPGMADDGLVVWQNRQVLYFNAADGSLRLGTVPIVPASYAPQPYRLAQFTPSSQDRLITFNITQVQVSDAPLNLPDHTLNPTPVSNPVYVSVTAQKAGFAYVSTLSTAIVLDNGIVTGGVTNATTSP